MDTEMSPIGAKVSDRVTARRAWMNRVNRFVMRLPIGLYRVGLGGLLGRRFLLLEHTGRSTGLHRKAVLEVVETNDNGAPVIVSGFGERSQWCRNVIADPDVWFTRGRTRTRARAERLDHVEAVEVFERYRAEHPRAAKMLGGKIGVSLVDDLDEAARHLPVFRLIAHM